MRHIVTSKDGIQFAVESAERTVMYDIAYASATPAAELAAHGDFSEIKSLDDLIAPEEYYFAPRIAGPLERRAAFKVIKGGKS